jgi:phosphohistidine phosphatase
MKTLYLVRHAKSSWDNPSLDDIDRPLKVSGINDAYIMSAFLKEKKIAPELVVSSPAVRALSTAVIFTNQLGLPTERISIFREIYESSPGSILRVIRRTNPSVNSLMVFGHDPSLTNLFMLLTGKSLEKIPTSAVASVSLNIIQWKEIVPASGTLAFLHKPKEIKQTVK